VGDDDDRVAVFQDVDQLFDLPGGDGVEGGARLVHEEHSGSTASARAMHNRCCWPPERPRPLSWRAILHLVPERGTLEALLDNVVQPRVPDAIDPRTVCHVVVDGLGEGVGLLEHHSDPLPQPGHIQRGIVNLLAAIRIEPVIVTLSIRSLSRLRQRRRVVLPQPEGPMKAVAFLPGMSRLTLKSACFAPYFRIDVPDLDHGIDDGEHPRPREAADWPPELSFRTSEAVNGRLE